MTPMWGAIVALRLLIFSQVLLFALLFAGATTTWRLRLPGLLLMAGMLGYFAAPLLFDYVSVLSGWLAGALAGAVPAFLLWFVWVVFEDDRPLPPLLRLAIGLYLLSLLVVEVIDIDRWRLLFQNAKLLFALAAAVVIWQGQSGDLVEDRLRLRRWLAALIGAVVVSIVVVELTSGLQVPAAVEMVGMAIIFVAALSVNLLVFRGSLPAPLQAVANTPQPPPSLTADADPLIEQLIQRLVAERRYAEHDLRIGTLADSLGVQAYRLRRAINQDLGYRNFNQFVNQYRIDEAAQRLLQTPDVPVLTIAIDVGFRSISSFNTAFKARFALSPTQYRAQHLSNVDNT